MVCYEPAPMLLKLMSLSVEFTKLWIRPWKKIECNSEDSLILKGGKKIVALNLFSFGSVEACRFLVMYFN